MGKGGGSKMRGCGLKENVKKERKKYVRQKCEKRKRNLERWP